MATFDSDEIPQENLGFVFFKTINNLSAGTHTLNLTKSVAFPNVMVKANSISIEAEGSFNVRDYNTTPNQTRNLVNGVNGNLIFSPTGHKMFTVDRVTDSIKQYNKLSGATPFNLNSYGDEVRNIARPDTNIRDLFFSPSGHRLFIISNRNNRIRQFNLNENSTPYELNNYTLQSKSLTNLNILFNGLHFSSDGKRIFVSDFSDNNDKIIQFNHRGGELYELDRYSFEKQTPNGFLGTVDVAGMHFSPNGQFFHVGDVSRNSNNDIFQFKLNVGANPFEVDNYTFDIEFQTGIRDLNIQFAPDGSRMYINNLNNALIEQYNFNGFVVQNQMLLPSATGLQEGANVSIGVTVSEGDQIVIDVPIAGNYTIAVK